MAVKIITQADGNTGLSLQFLGKKTATVVTDTRDGLVYALGAFRSKFLERMMWRASSQYHAEMHLNNIPALLKEAEITVWNDEVYSTAIRGCESFIGTELEIQHIPPIPRLWIFNAEGNEPKPVSDEVQESADLPEQCFLYGVLTFGVRLIVRPESESLIDYQKRILYSSEQEKRSQAVKQSLSMVMIFVSPGNKIPYLRCVPAYSVGDKITLMQSQHLAMSDFLKLPFVSQQKLKMSRSEYRQFVRTNKSEPNIKTVILRKAASKPGETETEREYNFQWVVKGHWRKQWYPSEERHKPKWIEPYLKGPEDAPLKPPTPIIYHAKR